MKKTTIIKSGIALSVAAVLACGIFFGAKYLRNSNDASKVSETEESVADEGTEIEEAVDTENKNEEENKVETAEKKNDENTNKETETKKTENKDSNINNIETKKTEEVKNNYNTSSNAAATIKSSNSEESVNLADKIINNDSEYIRVRSLTENCKYIFCEKELVTTDSDYSKSLVEFWGIPKENYYLMRAKKDNVEEDLQVEGDYLVYLVGVSSGNIILIPAQGNMDAYQIKNNKVAKTYPFVDGESYKWR